MAAISGQITITNALDYYGTLYGITPEDTPFLSMAGGLTGGHQTDSVIFGWQTYDLRAASQPAVIEGAAAPTGTGRTRSFVFNVVQIFHETIEMSYTKLGATGQFATTGSAHPGSVGLAGYPRNPANEYDWQVEQILKQIARDVDYTFLNGTFVEPADSASARKTRGILAAITTHAVSKEVSSVTNATGVASTDIVTATGAAPADGTQIRVDSVTGGSPIAVGDVYVVDNIDANTFYLCNDTESTASRVNFTTDITDLDFTILTQPTADMILRMMQDIWDDGGIQESETRTLWCNSALRRYLTKLFITDKSYSEETRNIGGVSVDRILTDFGWLNVALDRFMPKDTLLIASMEQVAPVHMMIPGKGFLFKEELGRAGSAVKEQIYGEIGLEYGYEGAHGKLYGLHGVYDPA